MTQRNHTSGSSPGLVGVESGAPARRKGWLRFVWLVLLAQCTLFWQGCDGGQTLLSLGIAGPALTVGYEGPTAIELKHFSPGCLAGNVLAVAGAILLLVYGPAVWLSRLASRTLIAATALVTAIHNSVLYFAALWIYAVFWPINWVAEFFFGAPTLELSPAVLGTLSRLYFLACIALMWLVLRLIQMLLRRYFFVAGRWQFSLAGLLVLMVLLGTGIGMLLRLLAE